MKALGFGFFFGFIAWFSMWVTPWIDPSGFNRLIGLENDEAIIASLFFILGLGVGSMWEQLEKLAAAQNKLVDRVEQLELRLQLRERRG